MPSFLSAAVGSSGRFSLVKEAGGAVVVPHLTLAIDSASRRKGLLGREGLPEESGLIIAPSTAVHTFFMRFPIDIVFLTREGGPVDPVVWARGGWRRRSGLRRPRACRGPGGALRSDHWRTAEIKSPRSLSFGGHLSDPGQNKGAGRATKSCERRKDSQQQIQNCE
jgi:hypothetical protein